MDRLEKLNLLRAMYIHGDSFASALAWTWMRADAEQEAKLETMFGDLLVTFKPYVSEE